MDWGKAVEKGFTLSVAGLLGFVVFAIIAKYPLQVLFYILFIGGLIAIFAILGAISIKTSDFLHNR